MESKNKEEDLFYLKKKIEAGSDFIITQLFYDVEEFLIYQKDCLDYGIKCPIIPGILPINNYNSFKKIINLCKISVPKDLQSKIDEVKLDDEKVKEVGILQCVEMSKVLLENNVLGIHFYTMNLERSVDEVLNRLNIKKKNENVRELPWKRNSNPKRCQENVRPIFWKNNSKSYLKKTFYWDEFPNGIWGDSRSPAFGNIEDQFISFSKFKQDPKKYKEKKSIWGENIFDLNDVAKVFINYIEGKINKIPWCEETELSNEISLIKETLIKLNMKHIFTINSQPSVNGVKSQDKNVGWGPCDGYVYQKMYIEFFINKEHLKVLETIILNDYPQIFYQAVNKQNGK